MVLLGYDAQLEACFGLFGDSANLDARKVHSLCQAYHRLRNHFERTRWYSLVTRLNWKLVSVCLEIVLILKQDSCTVCCESSIGSKIVLVTIDSTPR
jgi:hypothetical protein